MDISSIIVALDDPNPTKNYDLMDRLAGVATRIKIGSIAFSSQGPKILEYAHQKGFKIFLDLKFHDIPQTVSKAVLSVTQICPIEFITIHALGGSAMIQAAKEVASMQEVPTSILAVTILTSHEQAWLSEISLQHTLEQEALTLGNLAKNSGADGVVCSAHEVSQMRSALGNNFIYMVPGIRLEGDAKHDQKRVATPKEALDLGATYLVMGRSITEAKDPASVLTGLKSL